METPKTIEDILKDPEAIKALLKNVEVQKMMPRITPSSSEKTKKEGIKTTKKYDRYEQFNGILITVTHKRIKEGWKTFSIRANGRSEKECEAVADEEVSRLKRRYHIA